MLEVFFFPFFFSLIFCYRDSKGKELLLQGSFSSALRSLSSSSGFYMFSLRKPVEEESDLSALAFAKDATVYPKNAPIYRASFDECTAVAFLFHGFYTFFFRKTHRKGKRPQCTPGPGKHGAEEFRRHFYEKEE